MQFSCSILERFGDFYENQTPKILKLLFIPQQNYVLRRMSVKMLGEDECLKVLIIKLKFGTEKEGQRYD